MGSSGASRFSDYPESPRKTVSSTGGRGGISGGSSGVDRCDQAFTATLEDYERSEYHAKHGTPPKVDTKIAIEGGKRLIARVSSGESLGNLPTALNYLAACIAGGHSYRGTITAVSGSAVVKITIDAGPK